jgi:hypothetical protein
MKRIAAIMVSIFGLASPVWAGTSYLYLPASACRPYVTGLGDCGACTRAADAITGRGNIVIPTNTADQTVVCDVTFPNSAQDNTPTVSVFWHANSTDTAKNACWRTRFVVAGATDSLVDLDVDGTIWSALTTTAVGSIANLSMKSDISNMTARSSISSTPADCNVVNCRNRPGALYVSRRGSSNCTTSLTAASTILDQINFVYTTP